MSDLTTDIPRSRLALIGLAAGLLGGGLGIGGGIILVPLLVALGFDRHRAHATSLAAIVFIVTAGAISFASGGEINPGAGIAIGLGGVVGSTIGATVMHRLKPKTLTIIFSGVLLVAAARMISGASPVATTTDLAGLGFLGTAFAIGTVAGFFAGIAGVGGGVVVVPASVLLLGLPQHEAQGTSFLAIIFTATAGTLVNRRNGRVRLVDGATVGLGGVVGSVTSSQIALGVDAKSLSTAFGFLVLFVALRSLYRVWRDWGSDG